MANLLRLPNTRSREKWAERISMAWREQVPSIFETGNLLEAAKAELKQGEWSVMVKEELPFSRMTAHRLMAISADEKLRDVTHVLRLPSSWGTLFELTKLTNEQFEAGIKSGAINPKMERKHVAQLRGIEPKPRKKKETKPPTLDDWCFRFSEQITEAFALLKTKERPELLAHLKGIIVALEEETNGK